MNDVNRKCSAEIPSFPLPWYSGGGLGWGPLCETAGSFSRAKRKAFTLVELLIVIGIIALLVAILLPTLTRAREYANQISCLSNLRQVGMALNEYIVENNGSFPYHAFWYDQIGRKGNLAKYGISPFAPIDHTGLLGDPGILAVRPLNYYVAQQAQLGSCPCDIGDAEKYGVTSCYDAYGTSFQVQWNDGSATAAFGVIPVDGGATVDIRGGYDMLPKTQPAAKYGKGITFNGVLYTGSWSQKIVMGDFNWQGNRPITDPRVLWHRPMKRNTRQQNMLFGDFHAEFFVFPSNYGSYSLPVDAAANGFW